MMPDGEFDLRAHLGALDVPAQWPPGLGIAAVRRSSLERVAFGLDAVHRASLVDALNASCAIPGFSRPALIDGVCYVDGGVHSPTNADLLLGLEVDVAVILSPMTSERVSGVGLGAELRRWALRRLCAERDLLHRAGTRTVVLAPDEEVRRHIGHDFLGAANLHRIVRDSFFAAGRQLASERNRSRLAPLIQRRRRAA
jgi:NTE family protein